MKRLIYPCITGMLALSYSGHAQTGPGGVGNAANNALWVRADRGTSTNTDGNSVTSWSDGSGNSHTFTQTIAAQQPVFRTAVMNGYPALSFDNNSTTGQNDYLITPDAPLLDNTAGLTVFSVVRPSFLGEARSIISKRNDVSVQESYMFFFYTSNYLNADIVNIDDRFSSSPTAFSTGTNYLVGLLYNGSLAATQRTKIFSGNTLIATGYESSASIPDHNSPLLIGGTHVGDPRPFGGFISEIIIYREALNETRRIIVNNYLSAKYNIPLASNDYYTMDNPGNGNYDHEMAGIGRISSTDLHNDSKGTTMLRILNPNNLDDNEFLFWGHDNGLAQANNVSDVPTGVKARLGRVWRASEVNASGSAADVGAVDIQWDLTGLGAVTASHLRMLIDTDNDGIFSDETPIAGATSLGGNIYRFAGVTGITNQSRFTLGTTNKTNTPLPVTLISFDATQTDQRTVRLDWKTASEQNNDFFTLERSTDLTNWNTVTTTPGAGNSSSEITYTETDLSPADGTNYYRLKQTDFDGHYTYSDIRSVSIEKEEALTLFPNPAKAIVLVNKGESAVIQLQNSLGQTIDVPQHSNQNATQLTVSALPSGVYFVVVNEHNKTSCKKLIVAND